MLNFFFLRKRTLWSPLPRTTCDQRIAGAIESTFDILPVNGGLAGMSGQGWARLKRRRAFQNSFTPVLVVSLASDGVGTRVETAIGPGFFVRVFVVAWCLGVASTLPWSLFPHPSFIVGGLMIGFMILLAAGAGLMGRDDASWLMATISELLDTRPHAEVSTLARPGAAR